MPGGELNGPGVDLMGVNAKGFLVAFANRQGKGIEAVVPTGSTFDDTNLVLTVGDFNRDGRKDVLTRSASTGDLHLRAGNGADGFAAPVLAGAGFGSVSDLRAVGDVTGDGVPDLAGTPSGGSARVYPGNGSGGFGTSYVAKGPKNLAREVASSKYDWLLPLGDIDGNGAKDVLVRARKSGTLWLLSGIKGGGSSSGSTSPPASAATTWRADRLSGAQRHRGALGLLAARPARVVGVAHPHRAAACDQRGEQGR